MIQEIQSAWDNYIIKATGGLIPSNATEWNVTYICGNTKETVKIVVPKGVTHSDVYQVIKDTLNLINEININPPSTNPQISTRMYNLKNKTTHPQIRIDLEATI